jgi:hypothetical protein
VAVRVAHPHKHDDRQPDAFLGMARAATIHTVTNEKTTKETKMTESIARPRYQESKLEDEPILGTVLCLPDGSIRPLSLFERVLVWLHLTSAKQLEARYFKPATP